MSGTARAVIAQVKKKKKSIRWARTPYDVNPIWIMFEELQLAFSLFFMELLFLFSLRATSRHHEDSMSSI